MAKITNSVNLESAIWNEIDLYMKNNNLSSRDTAIEWMILERKMILLNNNTTIGGTTTNLEHKTNNNESSVSTNDVFDCLKGW